jgi:hypothetical protein
VVEGSCCPKTYYSEFELNPGLELELCGIQHCYECQNHCPCYWDSEGSSSISSGESEPATSLGPEVIMKLNIEYKY